MKIRKRVIEIHSSFGLLTTFRSWNLKKKSLSGMYHQFSLSTLLFVIKTQPRVGNCWLCYVYGSTISSKYNTNNFVAVISSHGWLQSWILIPLLSLFAVPRNQPAFYRFSWGECVAFKNCYSRSINSSPLGQNGRNYTDDIFRYVFMNEKFCILIRISLKVVPKCPIDNKPALAQIMVWCRTGSKPLSEPMLTQIADAYMRH